MDQSKTRILVADDEVKYIHAIKFNLTAGGYDVIVASNGEAAVALVAQEQPDLVLLDVRMPLMDGFEACRRIREFSTVPIILLTAASAEADKVHGLDNGADDYVTKPFGADELMSRVRAVLRRSAAVGGQRTNLQPDFCHRDFRLDFVQKRVYIGPQEVRLTPTEYSLLRELVAHAGRVLVSDYLLKEVWGPAYHGDVSIVWQAIHRLRKKLEADPETPHYIRTYPGTGYAFIIPDE